MEIPNIYAWKDYKLLLLIPIATFLLSALLVPQLRLGIDMKGGKLIMVKTIEDVDVEDLSSELKSKLDISDIEVRKTSTDLLIQLDGNRDIIQGTALIDQGLAEEDQGRVDQGMELLKQWSSASNPQSRIREAEEEFKSRMFDILIEHGMDPDSFSYREVGPALSAMFFDQAVLAFILMFVIVAVVIYFVYRIPIPSVAAILSIANDIFISVDLMVIFGIPFSLHTLAALLMILGYSVDTDILLMSRVLHRRGDLLEKMFEAMKTGMTMMLASIVSVFVLFVAAYLVNVVSLAEIAVVLLFGLLGDIVSTWLMNGTMLKWYVEAKGK